VVTLDDVIGSVTLLNTLATDPDRLARDPGLMRAPAAAWEMVCVISGQMP
jgi:hypothetical protein